MDRTLWITLLTGLIGTATALVTVVWTMFWSVVQERKREGKSAPTLRSALTAVARQKHFVYWGAAVGLVATLVYLRTLDPVYASTALVRVWEVEPVPGTIDRYRTRGLTPAELADERQLLASDTLRRTALRNVIALVRRQPVLREKLPFLGDSVLPARLSVAAERQVASRIRIESPANSVSLLRVTARSAHPYEAALLANAFAEAYRHELGGVQPDSRCPAEGAGTHPPRCIQPNVRAASLVDPARLQPRAVHGSVAHTLLRGLLAGAACGLVLAIYRAITDDTIREPRHLKDMGFSVLGQLPPMRQQTQLRRKDPAPVSATHAGHLLFRDGWDPAAEYYRVVCNRLLRKPEKGDRPKVVLVTSATPAEGKTTAALNLAVTAARFGIKVAVLDADLRRGMTSSIVGIPRAPGLTNVLLAEGPDFDRVTYRVPVSGDSAINVIPSGTPRPNPSEILASGGMADWVSTLRAQYDLVLIDSAPALLTSDAEILAPYCDLCVVVVRSGLTSRDAVREAISSIPARRFAVVLNHVGSGRTIRSFAFQGYRYGYAYGYGYGYGNHRKMTDPPSKGKPASGSPPDRPER